MRKTISLSKTRSVPRYSRAKKAVSLLKEEFENDVKVSRELNERIWSRGNQSPPRKVTVTLEDGVLYPAEDYEEEKPVTESEGSEDTEDRSYSEVVDGTIDEVKEEVNEMESPDYDALIDAEKSGKDRKTLKEWFESQK